MIWDTKASFPEACKRWENPAHLFERVRIGIVGPHPQSTAESVHPRDDADSQARQRILDCGIIQTGESLTIAGERFAA